MRIWLDSNVVTASVKCVGMQEIRYETPAQLLAAQLQRLNRVYWKNEHEDFQQQAISDPDN